MDKISTLEKLRGPKNYETWKVRMRAFLTEKNINLAINYNWPQNKLLLSYNQTRASARAFLYILLACKNGLLSLIKHLKSAKEAWEYLRNIYAPNGFSSYYLLYRKLFATTLQDCNNSAAEFVQQIKSVSDDLRILGVTLPSSFVALWLLNYLNKSYNNFAAISTQSFR